MIIKLRPLLLTSLLTIEPLYSAGQATDVTLLIVPIEGISSIDPATEKSEHTYVIDELYEFIRRNYKGRVAYKETRPQRVALELDQAKTTVCIHGLKSSALSRKYNFISIGPIPPPNLIYNNQLLTFLPMKHGMVDLDALISWGVQGVIGAGRVYSTALSANIERGVIKGKIKRLSSSTFGSNIIAMVDAGRFAYTIDYSIVSRSRLNTSHSSYLSDVRIYQDYGIDEFGLFCSQTERSSQVGRKLNDTIKHLILTKQDKYRKLANAVALQDSATNDEFSTALESYIHHRVDQENN